MSQLKESYTPEEFQEMVRYYTPRAIHKRELFSAVEYMRQQR